MPIGVASFRVVKRVKDCDSDSLVAQWYCSASHMMYFVMHSLGTRATVQRCTSRCFDHSYLLACNIHGYDQKFSDQGLAKRISSIRPYHGGLKLLRR